MPSLNTPENSPVELIKAGKDVKIIDPKTGKAIPLKKGMTLPLDSQIELGKDGVLVIQQAGETLQITDTSATTLSEGLKSASPADQEILVETVETVVEPDSSTVQTPLYQPSKNAASVASPSSHGSIEAPVIVPVEHSIPVTQESPEERITRTLEESAATAAAAIEATPKVSSVKVDELVEFHPEVIPVIPAATLAPATTTTPSVSLKAPEITSVTPDTGEAGDLVTSATELTVAGTGTVGSLITLFVNESATESTTRVDQSGKWSLVWNAPENTNDNYALSAQASINDLTSQPSNTVDIEVLAAPLTLTLDSNELTTQDTSVTLNGTADAGSDVSIRLGSETYTVKADDDNNWSLTLSNLPEGEHTAQISVSDDAGRQASLQASISVHAAPTSIEIEEDTGIKGDKQTFADTITVKGTAKPDSKVILTFNGQETDCSVGNDGKWQSPDLELPEDGVYQASAITEFSDGTRSAAATFEVLKDSKQPDLSIDLDNLVTNSATPTIKGDASEKSKIEAELRDSEDTLIGQGSVSVNSPFILVIQPVEGQSLDDGIYALNIKATSPSGVVREITGQTLTIDREAPAAPDTIKINGDIPTDNTFGLATNTFVVSGQSEENATVILTFKGSGIDQVQEVKVGDDKAWEARVTIPEEGSFTLDVRAKDQAGNLSESVSLNGSVDGVQPAILNIPDLETPNYFTEGKEVFIKVEINRAVAVTGDVACAFEMQGAPKAATYDPDSSSNTLLVFKYKVEAGDNTTDGITIPANAITLQPGASIKAVANGLDLDLKSEAYTLNNVLIDTVVPETPTIERVDPDAGPIKNDFTTNAIKPMLTGKGEAGSDLLLFEAGKETELTTVKVGKNGIWQVHLPESEKSSVTQYKAVAKDTAGNTSDFSNEVTITIDRDKPTLESNSIPDTTPETLSEGESVIITLQFSETLYMEGAPTLRIKVGDKFVDLPVEVHDNQLLATYEVASGHYDNDGIELVSLNLSSGVTSEVQSKVYDLAGNMPKQDLGNIKTSTPIKVSAVSSDLTINPADFSKAKTLTPTFNGLASPGATVALNINSKEYTDTAKENGEWSITVEDALTETAYDWSVIADTQGVKSAPVSGNISIDVTAPSLTVEPVLSGQSTTATSDKTPTLQGTSEPGATIKVSLGDVSKTITAAAGTGKWDITWDTELTDGKHTFDIVAEDAHQNTTPKSLDVTIDSQAPVVTVTTEGTVSSDSPLIRGTCDDLKATIELQIDGQAVEIENFSREGLDWQANIKAGVLTNQSYKLKAVATDEVGNSQASDEHDLTVNTAAPSITITTSGFSKTADVLIQGTSNLKNTDITLKIDGKPVTVRTSADTGDWSHEAKGLTAGRHELKAFVNVEGVDYDDSTHVIVDTVTPTVTFTPPEAYTSDMPTFSGTVSEAFAKVTVTLPDGTQLPVATVTETKTWEIVSTSALNQGDSTITIRVEDQAGNFQETPHNIYVDSVAPSNFQFDTAQINSTIPQPAITGTGEAGAKLTLTLKPVGGGDDITLSGIVDQHGKWNLPVSKPLTEGKYNLSLLAEDSYGNKAPTPATATLDVTFAAPEVTISQQSWLTNNQADLTITGTAPANSSIQVKVGSLAALPATTDKDGNWSVPLPAKSALTDGDHNIEVTCLADGKSYFKDGQTSGTLVMDTQPPQLAFDQETFTVTSSQPTITGTGEKGAQIKLTLKPAAGDDIPLTGVVNEAGVWSLTPKVPLTEENYTLTLEGHDAAGNQATASSSLVLSLSAAPVELTKTDWITNNKTALVINGTAPAGSTVKVKVGSLDAKEVKASGKGEWSYTLPAKSALVEGDNKIDVTCLADNKNYFKDGKASGNLVMDTQAPELAFDHETFTVTTPTPTITGTGEKGTQIQLTLKPESGAPIPLTGEVNESGVWSLTPKTPLTDESYTLTLEGRDAAGNTNEVSSSLVLSLPEAPVELTKTDWITNNTVALVINGTAPSGSTVKVKVGSLAASDVKADEKGEWTITLPAKSALAEGDNKIDVTCLADGKNYFKDGTAEGNLVMDSQAPQVALDQSSINTTELKPTITGTGEKGAQITLTLSPASLSGSPVTLNGTVGENGTWSLTPDEELPLGKYTVSVDAKDAAGNVGHGQKNAQLSVKAPEPTEPVNLEITTQNNLVTKDNLLEFQGKAKAGSKITVFVDTKELTTTADQNGDWKVSPNAQNPINDGAQLKAVIKAELAGHKTESQSINITVDTQAPEFSVDRDSLKAFTATPTIIGTGVEPGSTIKVRVGDPSAEPLTTEVKDGSWSLDIPTPMEFGKTHTLYVSAVDALGNETPKPVEHSLVLVDLNDCFTLTGGRNVQIVGEDILIPGVNKLGTNRQEAGDYSIEMKAPPSSAAWLSVSATGSTTTLKQMVSTVSDKNGHAELLPVIKNKPFLVAQDSIYSAKMVAEGLNCVNGLFKIGTYPLPQYLYTFDNKIDGGYPSLTLGSPASVQDSLPEVPGHSGKGISLGQGALVIPGLSDISKGNFTICYKYATEVGAVSNDSSAYGLHSYLFQGANGDAKAFTIGTLNAAGNPGVVLGIKPALFMANSKHINDGKFHSICVSRELNADKTGSTMKLMVDGKLHGNELIHPEGIALIPNDKLGTAAVKSKEAYLHGTVDSLSIRPYALSETDLKAQSTTTALLNPNCSDNKSCSYGYELPYGNIAKSVVPDLVGSETETLYIKFTEQNPNFRTTFQCNLNGQEVQPLDSLDAHHQFKVEVTADTLGMLSCSSNIPKPNAVDTSKVKGPVTYQYDVSFSHDPDGTPELVLGANKRTPFGDGIEVHTGRDQSGQPKDNINSMKQDHFIAETFSDGKKLHIHNYDGDNDIVDLNSVSEFVDFFSSHNEAQLSELFKKSETQNDAKVTTYEVYAPDGQSDDSSEPLFYVDTMTPDKLIVSLDDHPHVDVI